MESRVLLSGTVQTELIGDTLFIRGDDAANSIKLTEIAMGGGGPVLTTNLVAPPGGIERNAQATSDEFVFVGNYIIETVVSGWRVEGLDGTVIEGRTSFETPTNIVIELGGGDDTLRMVSGRVSNLSIDMGWGADKVVLYRVGATGQTSVMTGTGNDTVELSGTGPRTTPTGFNNLLISTGEGDDFVYGNSFLVSGDMAVYTGSGDDRVWLSSKYLFVPDIDPDHDVHIIGTVSQSQSTLPTGRTIQLNSLTVKTYTGQDDVQLEHVWAEGYARIDAETVAIATAHLGRTIVVSDTVTVGDAGAYRGVRDLFSPYIFDVIFTDDAAIIGEATIESTRALRNLGVSGNSRDDSIQLGALAANNDNGLYPGVDVVQMLSARSESTVLLDSVRVFGSWARISGDTVTLNHVVSSGRLPRGDGRTIRVRGMSSVDIDHLIAEHLIVYTGSIGIGIGNDVVRLNDVYTTMSSYMLTGEGNDNVQITNSLFLDTFIIDGGAGIDTRTYAVPSTNLIWRNFEFPPF
ncbi:MAG: hypothetical protein KDA88_10130 [Planctomycetaceae bacterium]|nr:hypothetical protein [Planctomycetaceae bacterium]MCB9952681.1 hypothetical protein [Planctomycetaceae bacterium]